MILGRIHVILVFDIEKFFKADLDCVGWNKVSLFWYIFKILFLKDSSTLSTTFGVGGM